MKIDTLSSPSPSSSSSSSGRPCKKRKFSPHHTFAEDPYSAKQEFSQHVEANFGVVANVECAQVLCPMTPMFLDEYQCEEYPNKKQDLCSMNPNKIRACHNLIHSHQEHKTILITDTLYALSQYAMILCKPVICGVESDTELKNMLEAFKSGKEVNTILLSNVGDNYEFILEADVIIQISSYASSRRQEARLLGRILRAKGRLQDKTFFYSLVSTLTKEMKYAAKMQQLLFDQGFNFEVITRLPETLAELSYHCLDDEHYLMWKVLKYGDDDVELEDDTDNVHGSSN